MDDLNSNANNGMITKIWGPPTWISLHSITFGYPLNPTDEQKENYKKYFELIGDILPCKYCRISYKEFISNGCTQLTDNVMKNRHTLTRWMYDIHERVNKKLGMDYGITFDDVVRRYETYRAKCSNNIKEKGCIMPLNKKSNSYKVAKERDCPIISLDLAKRFISYAQLRQLSNDDFFYVTHFNHETLASELDNKNSELWKTRNKKCRKLIEQMRLDGLPSIETTGQWKGFPTIHELKLILMMSTNIEKDKLIDMVNNVPCHPTNQHCKIYKLIK